MKIAIFIRKYRHVGRFLSATNYGNTDFFPDVTLTANNLWQKMADSAIINHMKTETKEPMTSMNISLPSSMKEFVEKEVASEGYGTVSEFFRELLRDAKKRREEERLEKLLLESLDSPASPMTKNDWKEIKERGLARLQREKRK